jgi:hypothetical protein
MFWSMILGRYRCNIKAGSCRMQMVRLKVEVWLLKVHRT